MQPVHTISYHNIYPMEMLYAYIREQSGPPHAHGLGFSLLLLFLAGLYIGTLPRGTHECSAFTPILTFPWHRGLAALLSTPPCSTARAPAHACHAGVSCVDRGVYSLSRRGNRCPSSSCTRTSPAKWVVDPELAHHSKSRIQSPEIEIRMSS